jgi:hypothetical protein
MMKKLVWLIMVLVLISGLRITFGDGSCQRPWPWQKQHCREIEQEILAETVRIAFHGWLDIENGYDVERIWGTISHATVVDGRYLLTHNHFGIPLSQVQTYNRHVNGGFQGVSVYKLDGTAILDHASLDSFVVISEKGETVMLDFGLESGVGVFEQAGVGSAEVVNSDMVKLSRGKEVAQIDWDGEGHTTVIWAEIVTVYPGNGTPKAQIDHLIELGASGGGVFLNGKHIGNNYGRVVQTNPENGVINLQQSLIALNS